MSGGKQMIAYRHRTSRLPKQVWMKPIASGDSYSIQGIGMLVSIGNQMIAYDIDHSDFETSLSEANPKKYQM